MRARDGAGCPRRRARERRPRLILFRYPNSVADVPKTVLAWIRSWRKPAGTWTLDDYPIAVYPNGGNAANGYVARVFKWYVPVGIGDTEEAALADLRANFVHIIDRPRPGTKVPIQFAAHAEIDSHGDAVYDLVEIVTGTRPFFLSDGSSLGDFADEDVPLAALLERIKDKYGVDVSDIENGDLVTILDRLAAAGITPSTS